MTDIRGLSVGTGTTVLSQRNSHAIRRPCAMHSHECWCNNESRISEPARYRTQKNGNLFPSAFEQHQHGLTPTIFGANSVAHPTGGAWVSSTGTEMVATSASRSPTAAQQRSLINPNRLSGPVYPLPQPTIAAKGRRDWSDRDDVNSQGLLTQHTNK